jgi:hypothetical protein
MSIWLPISVEKEPEVGLTHWQIMEVSDQIGTKSRHFVGLDQFGGRVSSSIQEFDANKKIGVTRSGRIYKLIGCPSKSLDAEYVWNIWKKDNKITEEIVINIFEKPND